MPGHRARRRLRPGRLVLTAAALLGTLCLALALAGALFGVKVLVFQSGSMGPDIPAGSLGLARSVPATELAVGDVVSVPAADGARVTHRIVAIDAAGHQTVALTLRGDANPTNDAETYRVAAADRLVLALPYAGHLVAFLGRPPGLLLLGGLALGLLGYALRPTRTASRHRLTVMLAAAPAASLVVGYGATGTSAAFTDTATVDGGAVAAHTMASQAQPTCTDVGGVLGVLGTVDVAWPHRDTRYEYHWRAERVDTGALVRDGVVTPAAGTPAGATVTQNFSTSLLNLGVPGVNLRVVIRARVVGATQWTAATTTVTPIRTVSLVVGLSMRCGNL